MVNFKDIDKKYRARPFWSWNDRLDPEETRRQIALMDEAGIGGFFMHARGGLLTEYMSDEWFENVEAAIDEAHKRGMHAWAYDENGWPSGFGDSKVTDLGIDYHQKILMCAPAGESPRPHSILIKDGYEYYLTVNPYYVDVMDERVTAKFLELVYGEYYRRLGNSFEGFFTDEPQMFRIPNGFAWSFTLPEKFRAKYGYDIIDNLDALFFERENSESVRRDFWKLCSELFDNGFMRQVGDWCRAHGYGFTGHLMSEDTLITQLCASGVTMPHYEHFTIPGIDWLGRHTKERLTAMQIGSAAAQNGQRQIMTETFALCGHNVSMQELRGILEHQMVRGVNLLCTHLEGYTNKGKRKRDYPPAIFFQQPWWDDAPIFFDSMARVGMLLAEGEVTADTLLIHPETSAWELYDGSGESDAAKEIERIDRLCLDDMKKLENKHVAYHLGDEIMMAAKGSVEGKSLRIGNMIYTTVILPEYARIMPETRALIDEFRTAGGRLITTPDLLAANPIMDENPLTLAVRKFDDFDMYYLVNSSDSTVRATLTRGNKILDIETGELLDFDGEVEIEHYSSAVIIDTREPRAAKIGKSEPAPLLDLAGEWQVKSGSLNSITLDRCDWRYDGGEWERDGYVLDILPRLNNLRREAILEQKYRFTVESYSGELFLVTETPERFEIAVNGIAVSNGDVGCLRDTSFRLIPITDAVKLGENEIYLKSTVAQSEKCYDQIEKGWTCEMMRNCLAFDMEIEQIYIAGSFGARLADEPTELERDAYRTGKTPVITTAPSEVDIARLDLLGYPEFSGSLTLSRTFNLTDPRARVKLKGRGINSIHLKVNGIEVATRMWAPYEVDISDYLVVGDNELELTLLGNLRNMQGPFHLKEGESYAVNPWRFYREYNIIAAGAAGAGDKNRHDILAHWDDGICLVHYGLEV